MNNELNYVAYVELEVIPAALNFLYLCQRNKREKWGKMNNLGLEQ